MMVIKENISASISFLSSIIILPLESCEATLVYRHGQNPKEHDRFRCRACYPELCSNARATGV
ncbi:IS1 family transposase [Yokenella regensburgei]|uniref:IS1 family transposase n=1 Tax=Yokenella regensburgei TaxID=158877 RepID=UPI003EDA9F30